MLKTVTIYKERAGVAFFGKAECYEFETDPDSGCKIARCHAPKIGDVCIWKMQGRWVGWTNTKKEVGGTK